MGVAKVDGAPIGWGWDLLGMVRQNPVERISGVGTGEDCKQTRWLRVADGGTACDGAYGSSAPC